MNDKSEEDKMFEKFASELYEGFPAVKERKELNFLEILNIPRDISPKGLAALVYSSGKVIPKKADVLFKDEGNERVRCVGVVEMSSERDAHIVANKLKSSAFTSDWRIKICSDPQSESK